VDIVHYRCAGLDISKRDVKVRVRTQEPARARANSKVTTWAAITGQILALREHLITERVTLVVMEATSDYWKPFYYLLEEGLLEVMLVNAKHVKNLPGRKADVSNAAWLAQLGAHGLVRARPERPGGHGQGQRLRNKIPELTEARNGRFSEHHAFLVQIQLDLIDQRAQAIDEITARIEVVMEPFRAARDLISTIPGISTGVADVIIAENGAAMNRFPPAGHLASWAGVSRIE